METRRNDAWEDDFQVYSEGQVAGVLDACGIEIDSETSTHFLCYCPFHGNTDTTALAVDKSKGLWNCFNPSCNNSGTLVDLPRRIKKMNPYQCLRLVNKFKHESSVPMADRLAAALEKPVEYPSFSQDVLDRMHKDFWGSTAHEYMSSRGFEDKTLEEFKVGYSAKQGMVAVPMHDPNGNPIGIIGRTPSHEFKRFKNSNGLPKSKTAFNFHRAKKTGGTVIICEASYDAMRIHQAGYPNVVALLGGHITAHHAQQLGRTFDHIINMTDFDKLHYYPNCNLCRGIEFPRNQVPCIGHRPGRDLGRSIASRLPNKKISWAAYDSNCVYPHGAKDASDMTNEEIRQCLRNAIPNHEYAAWDIEKSVA